MSSWKRLIAVYSCWILLCRASNSFVASPIGQRRHHQCGEVIPPTLCDEMSCRWSAAAEKSPIRRGSTTTSKSQLAAMKVTIRIVGRKTSERWIEDGCDMYLQRLKPANIELTTEWHKSNEALVKGVQADWNKNVPVVLLDPKGKKGSSESFSSNFYKLVEQGGSRLVYVIGGAEGLPEELRSSGKSKMFSLSDMTFTHQFARLLLIEQIYRASEIRKGSGYHK